MKTVTTVTTTETIETPKMQIIAVLDRSGSMGSIMDEALGALNAFVDEQRVEADADFTLVAFDYEYKRVLDKVNIVDAPMVTREDVSPRGMTALYDAVGRAINEADQDRPTILLIQTDGVDNMSREFTSSQIQALVQHKESKCGWDVNFIGAGLDKATVEGMSRGMGVQHDKTFAVAASASGMADLGATLSARTASYRSEIK
ncbi:von Willebrand factor type A [Vibrio phage 1.081.O._10N.286.52.C2]|nr:von Willebrand factor type A [Vibrio phage 1.081.O._10N.286.52.C2]